LQSMHNLARSDMNEPHYVIQNIWVKRVRERENRAKYGSTYNKGEVALHIHIAYSA
jgi:hypothetical protein